MAYDWVSPTGHSDPGSIFENETKAYDENTGSYASCFAETNYLYLTRPVVNCTKVRIFAGDFRIDTWYNPELEIWVHYAGGDWHSIFSGTITKKTWVEKQIGSTQLVDQARIKFHTDKGHFVHEFDFWGEEPPVDYESALSTAIGLVSVLSPQKDLLRSFTTGIGLVSVLSPQKDLLRTLPATIGLSTTLSPSKELLRTLSATMGLSAVLSATHGWVRTLSTTIGLSASLSSIHGWVRSLTTEIGLVAVLTTGLRTFGRTLSTVIALHPLLRWTTSARRRIASVGTNRIMASVTNREVKTTGENRDREAF